MTNAISIDTKYAELQAEFKKLQAGMTRIQKLLVDCKPVKQLKEPKVKAIRPVDTSKPFYRAAARWDPFEQARFVQMLGQTNLKLGMLCRAFNRSPGALIARLKAVETYPESTQILLENGLTALRESRKDKNKPLADEELLTWADSMAMPSFKSP